MNSTMSKPEFFVTPDDGEKAPSSVPESVKLTRWQIYCVDQYIKEHLHQCIRTTELASLLSLSVSRFSHAFKKTTGMTPLMHVDAVRVESARHHILSSLKSLSEIALNHGFCDEYHFCRIFRRKTGMSLQAWRELHTKNSPSSTTFTDC